MHLTHIEVSVPLGTLTPDFTADLDQLLHVVLGWDGATSRVRHPTLGPSTERTYTMAGGARLVLRECPDALYAGTDDHLGFSVEPVELDRLATACLRLAAADERVQLQYLEDGRPSQVDVGAGWFRTFFVRHLLPLWFQFETFEPKQGDAS